MLAIGDTAPDFALPDQDGRLVRLDELLAKGQALVYFYPADFTPVCTREACAFDELRPELAGTGMSLVGISPQDSASHKRFHDRYHLGFPLLADPDKRVIKAYGCEGFLGFGVKRVSYLVGTDKCILAAVDAAFRVGPHLALARQALKPE